MKLFDLHCDTPLELYRGKKKLSKNDLHVSLDKARVFDKYIQCSAIWCDPVLSDGESFELFKKVCAYFKKEAGSFITTKKELKDSAQNSFILTVEDSRLLSSDTDNIKLLYNSGVRVMTLLWGSVSSVGSAWNTKGPLTHIGKDILERCFEIGMIPDVSHANDEVCAFVIGRAKEKNLPVIATHSNSRKVHPHLRNLTDENAKDIVSAGGVVGISLYPPHLRGEKADISDIISHINHYICTLGTQAVCLGCDFDGIGSTPERIKDLGDLPRLYDALSKKYGYTVAESVFYNNAYNFFINNLP